MVRVKAIVILLVVSSLLLGLAGAIATSMACGWDFVFDLWSDGRCTTGGTPIVVWAGAVASFGVFMKFFWVALGGFALWRKVRSR